MIEKFIVMQMRNKNNKKHNKKHKYVPAMEKQQ